MLSKKVISAAKGDSFYMWTAMSVVIIGTFMAILDSAIVNTAIPKMMAVFEVSVDKARWIITSYTLTLGAVIPLTGYLVDRFSSKKVYIFALAAFTLGSMLCGLSWSNSSMIVFRIIQGLGGGIIMPVSMVILYEVVPMNKRGMALGLWGIAAMAAPTIGPTLSGYIIDYLDWRLIFTINIPIGVLGVIMSSVLLRENPKKTGKQFDIIGFLSSTVGIVFCLYLLGESSSLDWKDIKNILMLITGVFSLLIFVVNELSHPNPLLDLRLLKIFPFTLSIVITSVLNMGLFGVIFIMPLFLQSLMGCTPMQSGMIMFPSAIVMGICMAVGGRLFDKIGARPLVIPGSILLTIATYELSKLSLDTSVSAIVILLMLRSFALGFTTMPISTYGLNAVPLPLVARASALSNTIRQVSSSLSVTVLTAIMLHTQNAKYALYAADSTTFNPATTSYLTYFQNIFMQNGLTQGNASAASQTMLFSTIQRQTFMDSITATLVASTIFALVAIPMVFLIKGKKQADLAQPKHVPMAANLESINMEDNA